MNVEQIKQVISGVGEGIDCDADWLPHLIYETKDGGATVVQMQMDMMTQLDRNICATLITRMLKEADATAAVWITTAWSVDTRSLTKAEQEEHWKMANRHELSHSAKKIEVVVAVVAHRNPEEGPNTVLLGRIIRSAEAPKLDWSWGHPEEGNDTEAEFYGLFPEAVMEGVKP